MSAFATGTFAVGLAYFMPLDLCFSCWFFFVWRKGQQVLGELYGWNDPANVGWPYFREQSCGAWIGLALAYATVASAA